ncbi:MAG: hypothetical protein VW268_00640 [Rhodospirillaceae bacterium]
MAMYEFEIHNQEVADTLHNGDQHKFFKAEWADAHFIEFSGLDVADARRKAERRYPAAQGFVIKAVAGH